MIAFHPEPGRDQAEVRWVIPGGTSPVQGEVDGAPGDLGALLAAGTLTVVAEPAAVRTRLAPGLSWRDWSERVRHAVGQALELPGWSVSGRGVVADDLIERLVCEVLSGGPTADFVRSHGGAIVCEDVSDGVVRVSLHGTCAQCPAAGLTVYSRLERELRVRVPGLRALVA